MHRGWFWVLPFFLLLSGCKNPNQVLEMPVNKIVVKADFVETLNGDQARFNIDGRVKTVQFLQMETPKVRKKQPLGKEAKEFTDSLLKNAQRIQLRYDVQPNSSDSRIKAYVFADGKSVQMELLKNGLARMKNEPSKRQDFLHLLQRTELKAKKKRVGIWSCPAYVTDDGFVPDQ